MRLFSTDECALKQPSNVLLAPHSIDPGVFTNIVTDFSAHNAFLADAQKLRGRIALQEGAIDASQLSAEGRHIQPADDSSWHILTLDHDGQVAACARYFAHDGDVRYEDLAVSRTSLAKSETWGQALRNAVEIEIHEAKVRGCSYVELGGWVISEALRCTTEALRTIATAYAFAQLFGGGLGITTASTRRCSATILKRVGGLRLRHAGVELPTYYDEHYHCEMEILRFDAFRPNAKYLKWIEACRPYLAHVPVICRGSLSAKETIQSYRRWPVTNFAAVPGFAT